MSAERHAVTAVLLECGRVAVLPLTKQLSVVSGSLWSKTLQGARAQRIEMLLLHEFHDRKFILPDKLNARDKAAQAAAQASKSAKSKGAKGKKGKQGAVEGSAGDEEVRVSRERTGLQTRKRCLLEVLSIVWPKAFWVDAAILSPLLQPHRLDKLGTTACLHGEVLTNIDCVGAFAV